jgi:CubicO group peptidase (beta-lactamase class C family)
MNAPLQSLIDQGLAAELYLGASYAVLRTGDGVIDEGVAGLAHESPETPVTRHTVWDLASITKPVATATSILMLAQEGRFHLDEEVRSHLGCDAPSLAGITLRHCLTHSSGLPSWRKLHSRGLTPDGVRAAFIASERERPIGAGYAYSDLGYLLLGEVVRTLSGSSEAEFAQERIFKPLGMRGTRYLPPAEWRSRLAATRCPDRGRVLLGEVHDGNCDALGGVAGHAGLFGTATDLLTYATMLLGGGELNGVRVLCPLAVRQMATNQNPAGLNGHTLGWFTRPNGYLPAGDFLPADTFGHTGFTGTSLVIAPSLGLAVVLLTNRVYREREATEFIRFRRRFHNAVAGLLR